MVSATAPGDALSHAAPPRRDRGGGGQAVGAEGGHRANRGGVTRATSPTRRDASCFPSVEVCRLRIKSVLRSGRNASGSLDGLYH